MLIAITLSAVVFNTVMLSAVVFSTVMLSASAVILIVIMLSVVMLIAITLSVLMQSAAMLIIITMRAVMLSAVTLSVVAPCEQAEASVVINFLLQVTTKVTLFTAVLKSVHSQASMFVSVIHFYLSLIFCRQGWNLA
jgi:hypothetical protein